jgi:SAM-dependent methyltransferase
MHLDAPPSAWVLRWQHLLAPNTHALDLACGPGRHSRALLSAGCTVTAVDRDAQALSFLKKSTPAEWAQRLHCVLADIEDGPWPVADEADAGGFGAVVVTNYLWRPLWPRITAAVGPGGVLIYETFAQGHETIGRPSRPDFLLRPGELLEVCADAGLRVVAFEDGFEPAAAVNAGNARFVQRVAAVRPTPTATEPTTNPAPEHVTQGVAKPWAPRLLQS